VKTSTRKRFGGAILVSSFVSFEVLQTCFRQVKWSAEHVEVSTDGSGYSSLQVGEVEAGWPEMVLLATGVAGLLLLVLPDPRRKEPPELPPFRDPGVWAGHPHQRVQTLAQVLIRPCAPSAIRVNSRPFAVKKPGCVRGAP
jgi:hypothetical protein